MLSVSRLFASSAPGARAALAALALALPLAAHPGHGDAHAEPWYARPAGNAPAAAPAEAASTAPQDASKDAAEPVRAAHESAERGDGKGASLEQGAGTRGDARPSR